MLFREPFGKRLRRHRKRLAMTQRELGERSGISRDRIKCVEQGMCTLPERDLGRVAAALETDVNRLLYGTDYIGPGELRRWADSQVRRGRKQRLRRRYVPALDRDPNVRFSTANKRFPELCRQLEKRILAARSPGEAAELARFLNSFPVGSSVESMLALHVCGAGAWPMQAAPEATGFTEHPVLDPQTFRPVGGCSVPALLLPWKGLEISVFGQVGIKGRGDRLWVLDFLFILRRQARAQSIAVEVDGEGHRGTWDAARDRALQIPTLRLREPDILREDAWEQLWRELKPLLRLAS